MKFYTDEGNWDIVGNNMPVFFIQDAMKFPDLVHAVKPEPSNAIKGRRVALLVANGIDAVSLRKVHARLAAEGAAPRFVGARLGQVMPGSGDPVNVEVTLETAPSVIWDAVVVPVEDTVLAEFGQAVEFLKDQDRHCKPILLLGGISALATAAMLPPTLPDNTLDPGFIGMVDADPDDDDTNALIKQFILALSKHRVFEREVDPPAV